MTSFPSRYRVHFSEVAVGQRFYDPISEEYFVKQSATMAAMVKLREVRIGQLTIADVPAVVHENLFMSLLGQSFLTRLDSYEMRDGVLTLNYW